MQPGHTESFDIALQAPGTEVLIERWFSWPANEKFFKNSNATDRKGPAADMSCFALSGAAVLRFNDVTMKLTDPSGYVQAYWNSQRGLDKALHKALPEGLKALPPLPPGWDPRPRQELLRARDELHKHLSTKAVDVVLAEGLKAPEFAARRLACCCLGALDELSPLLEALEQEPAPDLRFTATEVLRNWIAAGRDHDYKLYDLLKTKYRAFEAETVMTLLHGFGEKDVLNPDTYELLIGYLNHPQMPIRELAYGHLVRLAPAGQKIRYSASADAATRQQAQAAWRVLIPPNQLPPAPMKKQ